MEVVQASLIIVNSTVAVFFNLTIFALVYRNRNLRTPFNYTILNACSADILVSLQMFVISTLSISNRESLQGPIICDITGYINLTAFVSSVVCLAAVSLNRYTIICHRDTHNKYFTSLGTKIYMASAWLFTFAISSPPLFGWSKFAYHKGVGICFVEWSTDISYMIFMVLICFCGPITVTIASLYFILKTKREVAIALEKDSREFEMTEDGKAMCEKKKIQREKEERKITLSILIVALIFSVSWGPFAVLMFVEVFRNHHVPVWIDAMSLVLGCLNSTANPIVYLTMNSNFRKEILKTLRKQNGQTSKQNVRVTSPV